MCKRVLLIFLLYLPILLLFSGFLETTSGLNQKGNKEFQEKHYDSALEVYRKAQVKSPENPDVRYNLGTTLYQLDQFQDAERELQKALISSGAMELKANAWYNYGNAQYRLGQLEKAEEAYRKALDLNPADKDAKYNLELLQKKKKIFELKQNKRDKERKQNPPPSQQQQQQQQGGGGKDREEKQSQNQQGQEQNQGQDKNQKDQEQEQKEKPEQQKEQPKPSQPSPESQSEEKKSQDQSQGQQPQQPEQKPLTPARPEPGEEQESQESKEKKEQQGQESKPLYQGQMSKENALRILDALRDSERELQLLRRPRPQTEREPLKDW